MSAVLQLAPNVGSIAASIQSITPELAAKWLARNTRNRPINSSSLAGYVRDMRAGKWQVTGEAIKFDNEGTLLDGQHRLTAVVQSGATVQMLVVRGIEGGAQAVMDAGRRRSAADQFALGGKKNVTILQGAARVALRFPAAGFIKVGITSPTNSEIAEFVESHPAINRAAEMAMHYRKGTDLPPSVLAIAWMRLSEIDVFATAAFFDAIATMATDGPGDPRLALARRIATARRINERLSPSDYLTFIFRAWNAWRSGKELQHLKATGATPAHLV